MPAGGRGARRPRGRSRPAPAPTCRRSAPRPVGPEGHRRLPHLPSRRKGTPPPSAVTLHTPLPTPWLPTAGSHRYPATKSFATPKATGKKVFLGLSLPLPRPRAQGRSRKSEITTCRLRRPPFSTPGPGSAPKVGAQRGGFLPQPGVRRPGTLRGQLTMVTRTAVAPLLVGLRGSWDSWNEVSWANFKSWFPSPKPGSRHPSTHRSRWEP